MSETKTFRTKTGYCHILEDKIVLTKDAEPGDISSLSIKNTILSVLIFYGILAIGLIAVIIKAILTKEYGIAIFFSVIPILLIYSIIASLNNSTTPIIERKSIQKVFFKKGTFGISRTRFEVYFLDEKGKTKCRLIMLPGSLTGGLSETDLAYNLFTEEKLIHN